MLLPYFALVIFQLGFLFCLRPALNKDSPNSGLLCSWHHRCAPPHSAYWLTTFCSAWPQIMILLISAFWRDGMSHRDYF
jgi:hypothetical protein